VPSDKDCFFYSIRDNARSVRLHWEEQRLIAERIRDEYDASLLVKFHNKRSALAYPPVSD
jgi:hypothetical protein